MNNTIVSTIIATIDTVVPMVNAFSFILVLMPGFTYNIVRCMCLHSILGVFGRGGGSGRATSFIMALLSGVTALNFTEVICLCALLGHRPLPVGRVIVRRGTRTWFVDDHGDNYLVFMMWC